MNNDHIIRLPNRQCVRASAVAAVRCIDQSTTLGVVYPPRVSIFVSAGTSGWHLDINCESNEERDRLAVEITAQL